MHTQTWTLTSGFRLGGILSRSPLSLFCQPTRICLLSLVFIRLTCLEHTQEVIENSMKQNGKR